MVDSTEAYERGPDVPGSAHLTGDPTSAEPSLRATIQAFDGSEGAGLEHVAALLKMGGLKRESGDYSEAEELFQRALAVGERALDPDNPALLPVLTSLAAAQVMCGKLEGAEVLVTRALAVSENGIAERDPDLVILLNDLACLCLQESAHAVAEPLLLRLLALKRSKGADHPEVATVLASLATARQALGRHESAEELWRRVLDIRERTLAPNHFALATAHEHLADACAARGKVGEALQLLLRAQTIRERTLGVGHPSLRVSRDRIADLQLQASDESLDASAVEPPAPERYRLLSADHNFVSAPRRVRDRGAIEQRKRTTPIVERGASVREPIAPPPMTTLVAEVPPTETAPARPEPVPYRDVIMSIQEELEDDNEPEAPFRRIAQIVDSSAASMAASIAEALRRPKAAIIIVGAVALLVVLATVSRAWSGSAQWATAGQTSPPSASAVAARLTPEISGRLLVHANDPSKAPATASAAGTPVAPSSQARVAEQRSLIKKPTDRRGESTRISIPKVPAALMTRFDSAVREVTESARGIGEGFPLQPPPMSGGARRVTFRDDPVIAPQRPRLIGALPTPRYPNHLLDVEGEVRVRFDVDTSGRPVMSTLAVVKSSNELFTAEVLKVIPDLRFEPAHSGGPDSKATKDVVQIGFTFRPTK